MMSYETAVELKHTALWDEVMSEIEFRIVNETLKLRQCKPEELKSIQDKIALYEEIKRLPQDVIDREGTEDLGESQ